MSPRRRLALLVLAIVLMSALAAGCRRPESASTATISAAASLGPVLREIGREFEAAHPDLKLLYNLGSSGALASQVEQGAPVDLFLSAATEPMDRLVARGHVDPAEVRVLSGNSVVLVRPAKAPPVVSGWSDLSLARRVAMGNPDHVPAGKYGLAVLTSLGVLEQVRPRLVYGEDVRQVLRFVESAEADAGLVYRTDAASAPGVVVVAEAPAGSHPPVQYLMALTGIGRQNRAARAFAEHLESPGARKLLESHGFTPAP